MTLLTLGRRVTVVVLSFVLFTALQRAALTSSRQLRYEQAKHVDGLKSDSWILLKCFRSRVMAGSPWWPSWTLLKTETPIVGYPDAYRFDPYCRTALGVQRDLVKSLSTLYQSLHRHLATCWHNWIHGHAQLFIQHLLLTCNAKQLALSEVLKQPRVTKMDSSLSARLVQIFPLVRWACLIVFQWVLMVDRRCLLVQDHTYHQLPHQLLYWLHHWRDETPGEEEREGR